MQNEVLESEKYPEAFFHPLKISGVLKQDAGTQNVTVSGTFNIHGADHPLTVDGDEDVLARVPGLLGLQNPTAVSVSVIAVVVDPVETVLVRWWQSHIGKEVLYTCCPFR